jgi:hypothetical protein
MTVSGFKYPPWFRPLDRVFGFAGAEKENNYQDSHTSLFLINCTVF